MLWHSSLSHALSQHQLLNSVIQGGGLQFTTEAAQRQHVKLEVLGVCGKRVHWDLVRPVKNNELCLEQRGVCTHTHVLGGATSCVSNASQLLHSNHHNSIPWPFMIRWGKSSEGKQNQLHSCNYRVCVPKSKVKRMKSLSCWSEGKLPQKARRGLSIKLKTRMKRRLQNCSLLLQKNCNSVRWQVRSNIL